MTKKLKIVETVLRDGQQSQIATRMTTEEMLPILEVMDQAGYYALEVWGGAVFDSCLRYLDEDPWQRLRDIREHTPNTKLQMLLRGQNLLGYHNYPDDVVEAFVKKSVENGIDIVRIFDALNDVRNIKTAVKATKEAGGHAQVAVSYTTSPIHTVDYYVDLIKEIVELEPDSICIKDMAGVLTPAVSHELVTKVKKITDLPLNIHTHATSGNAEMTYLVGVEAGADIIDTAISSFSGGTSQPASESLALSFEELGYDTGLDIDKLSEMANYFNGVRDKYRQNGTLSPKVKDTEPKTLIYQVPGGMLSNLLSQLKDLGQEDKYEEVLAEVPNVRKDLGYPPLVTPLSQMVGTQALMNVMTGERYKIVPSEIKDYVKGLYGRSPVEISPEMVELILGEEADERVTNRPADNLEPGLEKAKEAIGEYADSLEDVLSYALFPESAENYLKSKKDPFWNVPVQTIDLTIEL